jgi:hypothetical protein
MSSGKTYEQTNRWRWLSWALWALALAGLGYLAGLTLWLAIRGLVFPYQLDYGEGVLLHFVREWAAGRPIYKAIEGYPYITSNYAPLPILLAMALTPILGLSFAAGRGWTLLAVVAITILIAAWVWREGRRWLPAAAVALIFLGSPYIYHWAPLFRVDLLGLALTLGGLYAVCLYAGPCATRVEPRRTGLLWLAVILFVAGLYAKQSFIFAPAAALVYLFLFVDRWLAIKMAAAMAVLGGGAFLLINLFTGGGFWEGLVVSNVNPFLWSEFWKQQADFFATFALLGLLAGWYVLDKVVLDRATAVREKVSPLDLYLPAALASLWLAGKAGAWENYFFEALAALALCAGLGLARLTRYRAWTVRLLAPLLVLAQVGLMWHTPRVAARYLELTHRSNKEIASYLAGTPDPVVSEDMGLLVTNGKVLDYYSFQYSQLARAGRWNQAWELGRLRDRAFSKVILEQGTRLDVDRYQRFTREFLSELDRNYRHAGTVGKYELYEPDPLQYERRAEFGDQLALVGWSLHTPPDPPGPPGQNGLVGQTGTLGLEPGETLTLTVVWRAQQPLMSDYTAFAHLVDEAGQGWAGDDHQPHGGLYPTTAWGAGEMVRDTFTLTVPGGAPAGLYHLQVGWYDPAMQTRLPVGEGDTFRLAVVPVKWEGTGGQIVRPLDALFGEAIALEGYAWQVDSEAVEVTLRWSVDAPLDTDYAIFVHLVDPEDGDRLLAQGDAPPLGGRWPTSLWLPGLVLDDLHTISLPAELAGSSSSGPPRTYHLLVGLYDPVTGDRLTLPDGSDAMRLTGLEIPAER